MNMKRCENGHLYNPKKYEKCPYCDESVLETENKGKSKRSKKPMTLSENLSGEGDKTVAYWDGRDGLDPVVGWIVCIEGSERGKDYKIASEKNFVGRSEEMHIFIQGDNSISRRNHAVISYNPKKRNFVLIPGEGNGIIYTNNEEVYSPKELSPYDVIEMGKSKFLFIPFCGQHFEWEQEA